MTTVEATTLHVDKAGSPELQVGERIGRGLEAAIHRVSGLDGGPWAAKLYHEQETAARKEGKLRAMLQKAPRRSCDSHDGRQFPILAWPDHLLRQSDGQLAGFLMRLVEPRQSESLESFSLTRMPVEGLSDRERCLPQRLRLCLNLASIVAQLHAQGHFVVDFKPGNVRVHRGVGWPCLMDTDSFSILAPDGRRFAADAITPDYASPEILRSQQPLHVAVQSLVDDRFDRFALAVIIFQVLDVGIHPFQGITATDVAANTADRIREGLYAYGVRPHPRTGPRHDSIHETFPSALRELFDRAITGAPDERPSADEWCNFLRPIAENDMKHFRECAAEPRQPLHIHFDGAPCPECLARGRVGPMLDLAVPGGNAPPRREEVPEANTSTHRPRWLASMRRRIVLAACMVTGASALLLGYAYSAHLWPF